MGKLDDKIAIVTGAGRGIGRAIAEKLAAEGATVVVSDVDERSAQATAEAIGGGAVGLAADVTDRGAVEAMVGAAHERFGRIDVLVNNAAIDDKFDPAAALDASRFEAYGLERFRRQLEVNVTGVFLCCQRIGTSLAERGSGSIINVASTYGVVAPDQSLYRRPDGSQAFFKGPAYPTSKGAVLQFTRYLAAYWGRRGVRVNALSPGGVDAGQETWFRNAYAARTALGRMAARGDYRGALVFLASDASAYMTGANLVVDGGFTTC
jgi:NAD(P)-dependent dehydrogenase (short-subunit alcohol dehydrogenase family)